MFLNAIRESRKRVYQQLTSSPDVMSLATGGVIPISSTYNFNDRTALGPHVFYYTQSYERNSFRAWKHRIAIEVVVPFGTYTIDSTEVDAYEYSEALQSAVMEALEPPTHGHPVNLSVVVGGIVVGDSVYIWQIMVETMVTLKP